MRAFYTLSEQIFAAPSSMEIAEKLAETLPSILQATTVRLYLWNRRGAGSDSLPASGDPEPMAISLERPPRVWLAGAAKRFQTRMLLNVPDVRETPLSTRAGKPASPVRAHVRSAAGATRCAGRDRGWAAPAVWDTLPQRKFTRSIWPSR